MPNIADFETVIVDTSSLTSILVNADNKSMSQKNKLFLKGIYSNMMYVKDRLMNVLHAKKNIYVICTPEVSITYGGYTNYDWCPFEIELAREEGETKEQIAPPFARYFQFVKKWTLCFEEIRKLASGAANFYPDLYAKPKWEVVAENCYKRPIAISLQYTTHRLKTRGAIQFEKGLSLFEDSIPHYYETTEDISGKMILLPQTTDIDAREAINIILEDFCDIQQKTPPPEGIDEILLPGEAELKKEIKEELDKIEKIRTKISGLEERNKEITQFKQLIYETGIPLEDICKLTLSQLGCKTDDSVEDFILITGDKEAIVEVKGRLKSILREDGTQVAQNRRNYAIQKDKGIREIKAILLGNSWRLVLPLEERAKKEPFSSYLVEDANIENMALVTTVELFKAYCAFLEGKISNEEIIKRLSSGIGPTKLIEE